MRAEDVEEAVDVLLARKGHLAPIGKVPHLYTLCGQPIAHDEAGHYRAPDGLPCYVEPTGQLSDCPACLAAWGRADPVQLAEWRTAKWDR